MHAIIQIGDNGNHMTFLRGRNQTGGFSKERTETKRALVRVVGLDHTVLLENQAAVETFGKAQGKKCNLTIGSNHFCPACPVYNYIGEPIKQISGNAVIDGRTYRIDVSSIILADGKPGVAEVFRDITSENEQHATLLASNRKMTNDLELARTLQRSILRDQLPDVQGYRFSSVFMPCETLGGDMYDCFRFGGDKVAMYIADVSGHGVMSAMLTVYLRQEIFSQFKKHSAPEDVLYGLFESYHDLNIDNSVYITAFVMVLDLKTGEISYTNAGHSVAPILFDGVDTAEITTPGMPVCGWQKPEFERFEARISPGGRLLLYTDGLDDVHQTDITLTGLKRLVSSDRLFGQELLDRIISDYATSLNDDVTLLLVEREA